MSHTGCKRANWHIGISLLYMLGILISFNNRSQKLQLLSSFAFSLVKGEIPKCHFFSISNPTNQSYQEKKSLAFSGVSFGNVLGS